VPSTLAAWPEPRILAAMRGWRRGAGPLLPWFRATPFAAAHHYRDRALAVTAPLAPPRAVTELLSLLPTAAPDTLWVLDLPGPLALWLAYELRRERALGSALCWNGWYDPRGALDGLEEIPLLLALGRRLERGRTPRASALVFDARRHGNLPAAGTPDLRDRTGTLDNRYTLNEEDAPNAELLRAIGVRRVHVYAWGELAPDLSGYVEYLEVEMSVAIADRLALKVDAHGS
jgi:hypothetical protein